MNDQGSLMELRDVCKEYPSQPEALRVLQNVAFRLDAGECVAIVGRSGCGKSTLLNLMGALDTPTSGQILFEGRDINALSETERARLRNAKLGFVFQQHHLLPQYTALENVLVPAMVFPGAQNVRERAVHLLERVGLTGRANHRPGQLSGGECQRVAVARALMNRPRLLLADEPTGSLNQAGAVQLADLLLEPNREEGMAVVLVTHSLAIAERMGRILELSNGRLARSE